MMSSGVKVNSVWLTLHQLLRLFRHELLWQVSKFYIKLSVFSLHGFGERKPALVLNALKSKNESKIGNMLGES